MEQSSSSTGCSTIKVHHSVKRTCLYSKTTCISEYQSCIDCPVHKAAFKNDGLIITPYSGAGIAPPADPSTADAPGNEDGCCQICAYHTMDNVTGALGVQSIHRCKKYADNSCYVGFIGGTLRRSCKGFKPAFEFTPHPDGTYDKTPIATSDEPFSLCDSCAEYNSATSNSDLECVHKLTKPKDYCPCFKSKKGHKRDALKRKYHLVDWLAVEEMIKVLEFGEKEYGADNWRMLENLTQRFADAAMRHIASIQQGNMVDAETGLPHAAHAMCCCMFMTWEAAKKHLEGIMEKINDGANETN